MPDISMCEQHACPVRDSCYRYTAIPNPICQTYAEIDISLIGKAGCNLFYNNKKYQL